MKRKIISAVLVLSMLMTCIVVANYSVTAVTTDKSQTSDDIPAEYSEITNYNGMAESNDDATIIQAWNWSYKNIESQLDLLAEQGFNTIQISPPNEIKEATKGHKLFESNNGWWMFYQPAGFQINESTDNALGTKSELVSMVKAAHAKGIKVIADSVINHMGTCDGEDSITSSDPMAHVTPKAKTFEPEIYNKQLFHKPWKDMVYVEVAGNAYHEKEANISSASYQDIEYWLTQTCTSRLPDLDTSKSEVQDAIYDYLEELVNCGIDGFRFDAAKHIETKFDTYYPSNFWDNTVTKVKSWAKEKYGKDLMSYGEILNTCGDGRAFSEYFPYMKVTDSSKNWQVANAFGSDNGEYARNAIPQDGEFIGDKTDIVLWNESHDTWENGSTKSFSKQKRNKTWAAIASRDGISSLYFARPASESQELGVASVTDWASSEVKEINKFANLYAGQGEYVEYNDSIAVIGRGDSNASGGAVLIAKGTIGSISASGLSVHTLANGTYEDRISHNTFTVLNGKISSGSIGSTGIAVLYSDDPMVGGTASKCYSTDSISVSFSARNVDYATYSVNGNAETRYNSGDKFTFGTSADTEGATYSVTLKGYEGSTVVASTTLTYTKVVPESSYNITFKTNGISGWSSPCIYYWSSATDSGPVQWPGTKMSGSGGEYTFTIDSKYDRIIFNDGSASDAKQTANISISRSSIYTLTSSSGGYTATEVGPSADKIYYPGAAQPTSFESEYDFGDVNRDKTVNINDVTMIQQRLVFLITFDVEQANLADYNRDGKLNIHDATSIQYALVEKE